MNGNTLIAVTLLAFAVNTPAKAQPKPDIQQVLNTVEDGNGACAIVNAHMTYLDSHGQKQVLDYKKFADSCAEGG